ncbi:MAG: hypothetical protein U9Q91_04450 [Candidatus Marinimicrobia bacterium]|nr:hypothetical protein [Candidatus Neomarinimicrobiota bacterium]
MDLVKYLFLIAVMLLSGNAVCAGEAPAYSNSGILTIPVVNSVEQPGFYQDVEFQLREDELWELLEVRTGILIGTTVYPDSEYTIGIEAVELVKTDSFPVQIFLKLSGTFTSGCGAIGEIGFELDNNQLSVFVYYAYHDPEIPCTMGFSPLERIIPLPVYSLSAGEYSYSVNDSFSGTFTLERDNELD